MNIDMKKIKRETTRNELKESYMHNTIIVIPAYQPSEKLIILINELRENKFSKIVIIDDGSGASYSSEFIEAKELGCSIVTHERNKGKGAALKTGIKFIVDNLDIQHGFITVDADGQHKVCDIIKVANALKSHSKLLILGVREFRLKNVPFKSYVGNKITARAFKMETGVSCQDTQTGLRGIPMSLVETALKAEGLRYEYEYNFLQEAVKQTNLYMVEIETVYFDNNEQSHFRPICDSLLIYQRPLKFIASSLASFLVDIILFGVIFQMLSLQSSGSILIATAIARTLSGVINYIINKKSVFRAQDDTVCSFVKYCVLFLVIMWSSAGSTAGLNMLLENAVLSKVIVDTVLFFFSYTIQKTWVFEKNLSKKQISKIWKLCATLFFIIYVSFTLINRFVAPQNVVDLDKVNAENFTDQDIAYDEEDSDIEVEGEISISEPIITETSYSDENIQVSISTIREYETDIYIADITVKDSSYLKAGLAENSFGTNVNEKTSVIASENNAIIAINGDYYGFRDYGYVMRNGYLYRDVETPGGNESLVLFPDGDMQIVEESDVSAQELADLGAVQIFSFGPGLISDGDITVTEETEVPREDESNPRTAIAMIEENHYIFMVADGRTDESEGLSLYEMAQVLASYNCKVAYNLDGGGSATMVFMGEVVNFPTTNGRDYKERSVSDIVYIGN